MPETVNQETQTQAPAAQPQAEAERTFTQSEMNAILADRLARERGKYADYEALKAKAKKYDEAEEAGKSELQKANERADGLQKQLDSLTRAAALREMRARVAQKTNVPEALLSADTEEACTAQAKAILKFARSGEYPVLQDGGEPDKRPSAATRDQFAAWAAQSTAL